MQRFEGINRPPPQLLYASAIVSIVRIIVQGSTYFSIFPRRKNGHFYFKRGRNYLNFQNIDTSPRPHIFDYSSRDIPEFIGSSSFYFKVR